MKYWVLFLACFSSVVFAYAEDVSMTHSFSSTIGELRYSTTIYNEHFSSDNPDHLTELVEGEYRWCVKAAVDLEEAALLASNEAKLLLGDKLNSTWLLKEAGREVSGGGGRYLHHYIFSFQPDMESRVSEKRERGFVQIVVLLDGTVIKPKKIT